MICFIQFSVVNNYDAFDSKRTVTKRGDWGMAGWAGYTRAQSMRTRGSLPQHAVRRSTTIEEKPRCERTRAHSTRLFHMRSSLHALASRAKRTADARKPIARNPCAHPPHTRPAHTLSRAPEDTTAKEGS